MELGRLRLRAIHSTRPTEPRTKTPIRTSESRPRWASSARLYSVPSRMTPVLRPRRDKRIPFSAQSGILNTLTTMIPASMPNTT